MFCLLLVGLAFLAAGEVFLFGIEFVLLFAEEFEVGEAPLDLE